MDEVSCRALAAMFRHLQKLGHPLEPILAGMPFTLEHALGKDNRVGWDDFLEVVRRMKPLFASPEAWQAMGRSFFDMPEQRPVNAIYRLIASPRQMHKWAFRFGGFRLFSNMDTTIEEDGHRLLLNLTIREPYPVSNEYFWICQGVFGMFPRLVGLPEVPVSLELQGRTGRFRIDYTSLEVKGRRRQELAQKIKLLVGAFRPRAELITEFEQNHLLLEARYKELERAKARIESQQRALQVVYDIATASHQHLRLDPTVAAIAEQVHRRLGFGLVHVRVELAQDERRFAHEVLLGDQLLLMEGTLHREPLGVAGRELGYILVSRGEGELPASDKEIIRAVAESTALAVNNAVAYEVIRSYREELEQRVAARTAELSEARDQIARSLESRNRFFANVNHELRTPLTVLLLGLERLAGLPALVASRGQVATMQRNAERLQSLVDDLLLLAAGAEVGGKLRLAKVDAPALVGGVAQALRLQAEAKGLQLLESTEPGLELDADSRALDRALFNLVSNAIKYTGAGRVEVRARREGEEAVFEVEDTGEGIPAEYLARVFERFVQVPGAKARPGAGIGLALVKEIAAQHGGTVEAKSELGRGSRFTLRLPVRAGEEVRQRAEPLPPVLPAAPALARPSAPVASEGGAPAPARDAPLVLVCEDNPELSEQLHNILTQAGLRVSVVHSAEEALARAEREPPDLLLTDVGLGTGMDGMELCRAFCELKAHRNAPCLVLTANSLPRSRLEAFQAGAVDFIVKPFAPSELIARVQAQLQLRRLGLQLLASERLAAQGAALAGVAHELRNPLNGLINAVEPLRMSLPSEATVEGSAAQELLGVIEECGKRVASLSAELLSFARREPGPLEPVGLGEVVGRALKVLGPRLARVELRSALGFEGLVLGSGGQLSQVVINLLDNAIYAAGEGGWVEVASRSEGGRAVLEVRDSGPGVPAHLRERIFEPFFTTKPPGQGTGLGLSISRSIVRRHGGELWVRAEGERTALQMWLPLGEDLARAS